LLVISRRALLSSSVALLPGCRPKAAGFPGYAFVANEDGQGVAAVDLNAFVLARHVPLGASPTSVAASSTRKAVYALTPQSGLVHEIDPTRLEVRRRARVARSLTSMRLSQDGQTLWVLSAEARQLVRLPLEQFQPDMRIPLPAPPVEFDLTADGRTGAVTYGTAGLVGLMDLHAGRAREPVHAGSDMGTARFRPDGMLLLVADRGRRVVTVMETLSGKVLTDLSVAVAPENFCFKSDGGEMFVSGQGMDAIVIVNPYYTEVTETFLAGRAPGAMAISRSPEYLFVTNSPSGDVTIINVDTRRAIAVVAVGSEPSSVTITPDDRYALVLNRRSGTMAVIRLASVVPRRAREAPLFTTVPVGSKPVSLTVLAV
jgi:YVTN family beta-propeller protein